MPIRVALRHVTHYRYDRLVELAPHVVRLRPAPHCRTPIEAYSLKVSPEKHFLNWQQDPFGNWQARLVFPEPLSKEVRIEVDLIASLVTINPFDFFVEKSAEKLPFVYEPSLLRELRPYLETVPTGPKFAQLLGRVRDDIARDGRRSVDVLVDLNQLIQRSLRYDIRMEPGVFAPEETLERGHGSCRDFAWLVVNLLRHLGYAARFVSGYSIQLVADQKPVEGPVGVDVDCTDLHAWAEAYLPGAGWIGLDATSGLLCGEGHIPLACTAEPSSAAPVTGSYGWHKDEDDDEIHEELSFTMDVTRIEDRPRPTKPYTDAQWSALLACGDRVDEVLQAADVRLTMGGEPTFVSIDDPDGDEWNTTAVGPSKRLYADTLVRKLERRFVPGALLHHGQGKWYPGEPLPRWAYSCYYRVDGEPIWRNPALFAHDDVSKDGLLGTGAGAASEHAQRFIAALAERLSVQREHIVPAYEDVFYHLWRERRLPVNVDPLDSKLDDEQERERLHRVFAQGLGSVVGYALPLWPTYHDGLIEWASGPWFLRDERMYLIPGDSPMGYRLPLDSLPWSAPEDRLQTWQHDPMAAQRPLPDLRRLREATGPARRDGRDGRDGPGRPGEAVAGDARPTRGESAAGVVRTALCVEPRGGVLHVFMPPTTDLESYLSLVIALEDTAAALHMPVQIEGYPPPSDPRLQRLQVTPDPGVIEVNIQPARSWRELVDITLGLYDEAKDTRLSAEKFMIDGRHTGTGGGNHITLGGLTPTDSPFLRRPDLLRSFTGYWLNHPSLSYLFSGLFIGPTSQAPRLDEARGDSLYELDIAYGALPNRDLYTPPWLVDRVFRHLLVDVTGNTHRTELCIDKLYSPDGPSGRLGLVELRAFEMPPDARMSCATQLLVCALLAWFWKQPYERKVVRWGTSLFDRFMLPHYINKDFQDVLEDLARAGFALDPAWFSPHDEFRFPRLGRVDIDDATIELRAAIEPWHVLGEEGAPGGTTRYVDSSVERVQVHATNLVESRHVLTCNGRRVPLQPTGRVGEYVAGVRYRAWKPPSALHPTIDVHSPLVFDLLDTWSSRSLGGCVYHVSHPGGLAHELRPRNALEAESRRAARFFAFGHTPGPIVAPPQERSDELPLTLDLRRPRTM